MESFRWYSLFETGLVDVDDQHRRLVDLINALAERASVDPHDTNELFGALSDYADFHFQEEEDLMEEVGIDARHLRGHLEAHRAFFTEIRTWREDRNTPAPERLRRLSSYLVHWLGYHILGSDKKMARQVDAIRAGQDPAAAYAETEGGAGVTTGPLVRALDGLFQLISVRNRELSELNASLENRIAERTAALREANAQLELMALTASAEELRT